MKISPTVLQINIENSVISQQRCWYSIIEGREKGLLPVEWESLGRGVGIFGNIFLDTWGVSYTSLNQSSGLSLQL